MALSRRRKVTIILLVLYWPTFFILAHIPVPGLVRKADVSDKSLHFLAYLILVFLLWFAVSGEKKVNWRRAGVWWILFIVIGYGVVDELLQSVVGRNCDVRDMVADLAGTLVGLILFSIFTFWQAALLVAAAVIFGITNVARANLAELVPVAYVLFHLFAYAIFTMLWIQYMHFCLSLMPPKPKWLASALAGPTALLLTVKLFSIALGKVPGLQEIIISVVALAAVVVTICLTRLSYKMKDVKDMVQS